MRRWRRFDFPLPVRVTVEKFQYSSVISSQGSQVNAGGLAILADTELAIGDEAEIEFSDYNLTLRGVVRNQAGIHYGIKFIATSADEAERLGRFRQLLKAKVGPLEASA